MNLGSVVALQLIALFALGLGFTSSLLIFSAIHAIQCSNGLECAHHRRVVALNGVMLRA